MKAWLFQDKRGGDNAPWCVGWYDTDGKRRRKKVGLKTAAEAFRRKVERDLAQGLSGIASSKKWADFREEYKTKIMPRHSKRTRETVNPSLDHFERITKVGKVSSITTAMIDDFISDRRKDRGRKPESVVSPATINRDLRHIKAALSIAHEWGYLPTMPRIRMVREEEHIGPVMSTEHFQAIYEACDAATLPEGTGVDPGDFWRALLLFALTTGWRIEEVIAFRREDLDLETGSIRTRAGDNKGKRDDIDYLPEVALQLVRSIVRFGEHVFSWPHNYRTLWDEFHRIQGAAGIHLTCRDEDRHECTDSCHVYGFHALRRGYATLNADSMPAAVLQKKMRHKSFTTTLGYIKLADKMKKGSEKVYVPEFLTTANG